MEPYGLATIYDTVMALRGGEVGWAIVPIENSLEGSISVTLDLLAGEASDVRIVGEVLLRVRHSLIAAQAVELSEIETVITHPQVPGQCTRFLRSELPQRRILPAGSTAEAVRVVAEEAVRGQAALGTLLAAGIYGGVVIREGVEDRDDNETRFVWLDRAERADRPPPLLRGGRGLEDLVAVLGCRQRAPRLAAPLPRRVRPPGGQPDEDRVPAAASQARELHVLRRRRGAPL